MTIKCFATSQPDGEDLVSFLHGCLQNTICVFFFNVLQKRNTRKLLNAICDVIFITEIICDFPNNVGHLKRERKYVNRPLNLHELLIRNRLCLPNQNLFGLDTFYNLSQRENHGGNRLKANTN